MSRIGIIGGGITGLSACHFVRKLIPSAQVTLFERAPACGGWLRSKQIPISATNPALTIPIELGPNSIRGGNDPRCLVTAQLISDLHLSDSIVAPSESAKKRFIYSEHKLHSMEQMAIRCLLTSMLWVPWYQLFYYLKGGHALRRHDESIESFFRRNFGSKLTHNLATSFVNGVYGGGIGHLSISSCSPFNQIKQIENEYGSYFVGGIIKMLSRRKNVEQIEAEGSPPAVDLSKFPSFTFRGGLQQITNALVHRLEGDDHVHLHRSLEVESMRYLKESESVELGGNGSRFAFDYVLNAVEPRQSTAFLDSDTDLAAFNLSASMVTVNVVFRGSAFAESIKGKFEGFGVLIPDDDRSMLGIIYYSSVFPPMSFAADCAADSDLEEGEPVLSLVMMFGGTRFDVHSQTAAEIVSLCKLKLKSLYDVDVELENGTEVICDGEDPVDATVTGYDVLYNINRLNHAVDHYLVGHLEKMESLREHVDAAYHGKVSLIGSGYDGVGIPDCILSAYNAAKGIADRMGELDTAQTTHSLANHA